MKKDLQRLVIQRLVMLLAVPSFFIWGCAPALIGGGAAGGYKAATDPRSVGTMMDDATITGKVKTKMIEDSEVKARNIDVDTLNGEVTLTGMVASAQEQSRAMELARSVPGVKSVKNNLQIDTKTWGEALDDKVIGSKIKAKLIEEPGIRSLNIDVDVDKGVVTLTGIVENPEQKKKAADIARGTSGAVRVVDNLKVK
jgi:hyperosmotically inducible protein